MHIFRMSPKLIDDFLFFIVFLKVEMLHVKLIFPLVHMAKLIYCTFAH